MKTLLFFVLGLTATVAVSQDTVSMKITEDVACEKLNVQKMTFLSDGSLQNDQVVALEMEKLKACGLDGYDVRFFGRIDALSSLLKKMTTNKGMEFLTYGDLINAIDHMKETENFQKIKKLTLVSEQLANRRASLDTWEQDLQLFNQLGASETVKDAVYKYLRNHPQTDLTYQELLIKLKK